MHHILDALLDLGESDSLRAIEQHPDDGLRTAEHLGQKFELEGQGETRRDSLSESVVTLVSWELLSETDGKKAFVYSSMRVSIYDDLHFWGNYRFNHG